MHGSNTSNSKLDAKTLARSILALSLAIYLASPTSADALTDAYQKTRAENGKYNVFTISKQPFLLLNAPVFQILPTKRTSLPESIKEKVLNSTAPTIDSTIATISDTIKNIISKPQSTETASSVTNIIKESNKTLTQNISSTPIENNLVNIFCSQKIGNLRRIITGSGVLINDDGTVLTNAHVAEFPLIADASSKIMCLARTGSPAKATHSVKVAFISPDWINKNAIHINQNVLSTGQYDYAILKITPLDSSSNATKYSNSIEMLKDDLIHNTSISDELNIGSKLVAAAYPADIFGTKGVDSDLISKKEYLTVNNLFSFDNSGERLVEDTSTKDVIETSPSNIAQVGSSGGAVANIRNELIGTITTVVDSATHPNTSSKYIRAISTNYVDKDIKRYFPDGLSYIANYGSNKLKNDFDTKYRSSLTNLLLENL